MEKEKEKEKEFDNDVRNFERHATYHIGHTTQRPYAKQPKFDPNFNQQILMGAYFIDNGYENFVQYCDVNPHKLRDGIYNIYRYWNDEAGKPMFKYVSSGVIDSTKKNLVASSLSDKVSEKSNTESSSNLDLNKLLETTNMTQRDLLSRQLEVHNSSYRDVIEELKSANSSLKEQLEKAYESIAQIRNGENNSPILSFVSEIQAEKNKLQESHYHEKMLLREEHAKRESQLREEYGSQIAKLEKALHDQREQLEDEIYALKDQVNELNKAKNELEADIKILEEVQEKKQMLEDEQQATLSGLEEKAKEIENSNSLLGLLSQHGDKLLPVVGGLISVIRDTFQKPAPAYPGYMPQYPPNYMPMPNQPNFQQQTVMQPGMNDMMYNPAIVQQQVQVPPANNELAIKQQIRQMLINAGVQPTDADIEQAYNKYVNPDSQTAETENNNENADEINNETETVAETTSNERNTLNRNRRRIA